MSCIFDILLSYNCGMSTVEPSILATLRAEIIGLIIEVATFQGLIYTHVCNWDKQHVVIIERWPQFRG